MNLLPHIVFCKIVSFDRWCVASISCKSIWFDCLRNVHSRKQSVERLGFAFRTPHRAIEHKQNQRTAQSPYTQTMRTRRTRKPEKDSGTSTRSAFFASSSSASVFTTFYYSRLRKRACTFVQFFFFSFSHFLLNTFSLLLLLSCCCCCRTERSSSSFRSVNSFSMCKWMDSIACVMLMHLMWMYVHANMPAWMPGCMNMPECAALCKCASSWMWKKKYVLSFSLVFLGKYERRTTEQATVRRRRKKNTTTTRNNSNNTRRSRIYPLIHTHTCHATHTHSA